MIFLPTRLLTLAAASLLVTACASQPPSPETATLSDEQIKERRDQMDSIVAKALERLYAEKPEVKAEIEGAAGYGVFDVTTINAVMYVGATGPGVIIDNKTGHRTYMRAIRAGTGPGIGYQETFQVFIFNSDIALSQFRVGDTAGGDIGASATIGTLGGQISFNPYISVYQLNETGFAIQANWGGTGYVMDPNLN
jgi:lipid-binding SYLF domain-containing protein